jgi:hypothetical protein
MITFMITYEIRMDSQVTLIALIFFQNRSKYSSVKHNKDVLMINQYRYQSYSSGSMLLTVSHDRHQPNLSRLSLKLDYIH